MNLGENLRKIRKDNNLSQEDLADILKDEPEALRYAMEALTYAREK